jgi:hypothetical protein
MPFDRTHKLARGAHASPRRCVRHTISLPPRRPKPALSIRASHQDHSESSYIQARRDGRRRDLRGTRRRALVALDPPNGRDL